MVGEKKPCWRLQNDQWSQVPQNRFGQAMLKKMNSEIHNKWDKSAENDFTIAIVSEYPLVI